MTEIKKDGFFKRLFGGKQTGCCDIKIEEIKEESREEELESTPEPGCCSPDIKTAQ